MDLFKHRQRDNLSLNQDNDFDSNHFPKKQRQNKDKEGTNVNAQSHIVIKLSLAVDILWIISQRKSVSNSNWPVVTGTGQSMRIRT